MKNKGLLAFALCWGILTAVSCSSDNIVEETPPPPTEEEGDTMPEEPKDSIPETTEPEGCTVLQKATEGRGIDLVILGDGFTAKDIEAGKWQSAQDSVMKYMFQREPLKSFKHWFNVYATAAPYDGPDLSIPIAEGDTVESHLSIYTSRILQAEYIKKDSAFIYAYENTPVKEDKGTPKDMLVLMTINSDETWGSFTTFDRYVERPHWGHALVPFSVFYHFTVGMYGHEMMGHGIGDCADEYMSYGTAEFPADDPNFGAKWYTDNQRSKGINLNIAFTTDPDDEELFVNRAWAWMIKNNYHGVIGTPVEGAISCGKGVWRATDASIMGGKKGGEFDDMSHWYITPVQRELILRNLYKLAGKESEYSFDVFLEYDKRNEYWDQHPTETNLPEY